MRQDTAKHSKDFLRDILAKKLMMLFVTAMMVFSLAACGTKTLTCDGCGAKVDVPKNSNMTEDWTIYCHECEVAKGLDKLPE